MSFNKYLKSYFNVSSLSVYSIGAILFLRVSTSVLIVSIWEIKLSVLRISTGVVFGVVLFLRLLTSVLIVSILEIKSFVSGILIFIRT